MQAVSARPRLIRAAVLLAALAALAVMPVTRAPEPVATWTEVDALVKEQKLAEAAKKVDGILRAAREREDEAEWTKALIREVQLETGLHGYETAVQFLKGEPWPQGLLSQTTLDLFYAQCLVQYRQMNSWEIGKRERIESSGPIDLKAWTRAQIVAEAEKAYRRTWDRRAALGKLPVGALAEYVDPNNYPKDVRGTLRDAVSYLLVELYADSSLWTPEQSNGVYQLNLAALLATEGPDADAKLADPAAHPIEKLVAILGDLESWHGGEHQRAAQLEARLERLRRLHAAFSEGTDRAAIRKDLEERLPRYRDASWWSMGMAELAGFRKSEVAPDNLIRARAAALEGFRAYPQSPGGRRSSGIIATIEAPDYQATSMSSDGLDRRSIRITHKNLSALSFRAYRLDFETRAAAKTGYNLLPDAEDVRSLVRGGPPAAAWETALPPTPDFQQHSTYVTPPIRETGVYVIVVSVRPDFAETDNRVSSVAIVLSDLVLVTHPEASAMGVRALRGSTGQAVAGADVELWAYDWSVRGHHRLSSATSDERGLVRFAWAPGMERRNYFVLAKKGNEIALESQNIFFSRPTEPVAETRALVYTDRAIYRPLQRILWKVVAYRGVAGSGSYRTEADQPLSVTLEDADGQAVESKTLSTNSFGSAAGEFVIPAGRALGGWNVKSSLSGEAYVQVEEYKRPTFEVKWEEPKSSLRLNQRATLSGSARYYFGLPVSNGSVRWRIVRAPQFPWWWWRWGPRTGGSSQTVAQGTSALKEDGTFEATFTAAADERLAASAKDVTYRFAATADVTDEGGETRSDVRAFRLGFVAVEAQVRMETGFVLEGDPARLALVRTDLDGAPSPGPGSWRLLGVAQPERTLLPAEMPLDQPPIETDRFATPGDRLRPRWDTSVSLEAALRSWPDGPEKARGDVTHGAKGEAEVRISALPPGAWRLHYETRDQFGGKYETTKDFLVAGRKTRIAFPEVLLAERESVGAGEIARFLVSSGLPDQLLYFDVLRDGKVVSRHMIPSSQSGVVELPVSGEDRGGFAVRLSLLRDHQFLTQGNAVLVPWDDKVLQVSFASFRDRIRPGAKETWRVTVKAPAGTPSEARAAELLAYMYDRSLDFFVEPHPPQPLSLYPDGRQDSGLFTSLGPTGWAWVFGRDFGARPLVDVLHGDRLKFFEGYGIGGPGMRMAGVGMIAKAQASVADAAAPAVEGGVPGGVVGRVVGDMGAVTVTGEARAVTVHAEGATPPPAMRSDFSETAFWKPQLLTDADGSAVIEFQVPDSVTSWNVWVHAITRDLEAGSVHRQTRSVKDLMVRPYVPRFLREGDTADLKVVVNNASDRAMSGTVALDILDPETNASELAEFGLTAEKATQAFSAAPGGGANATFALTAPKRVGSYAIKATAVSGDLSDGELRTVPVLPGRMQLSQSWFVTLKEGEQRTMTFADMAKTDDSSRVDEQLVVTVDAQLFYSVLNALPYLVNYPYECTEQTMNRFVSTGIVSSLYRDYPAVAKMAEEMSKRETPLEAWAAPDPTRRMELEETPWLEAAKGGKDAGAGLANVLDPRIAKAEREASLAKLRNAQTAIGAFPWWPGGPPSPYMTLYILSGLARASEFGVDVPKDLVARGWGYLTGHFRDEYAKRMAEDRCDWEWLTFLNYVATCYPDPSWMGDALRPSERAAILAFSFQHWKEHSPYLKGLLTLTLKRMGRPKDAALVWASVMDSSKTDRDRGTYWAPENRAWLWYNDTIETQAFALRTLMELDPADSRRHGLVQWLFLNKKLNQWKSTRATAEVIYSLVWYLKKEGALGVREDVSVEAGGQKTTFAFEPDRYTGKRNQVVIPGEKIDPKADSTIAVSKGGKGLAFASATWNFSTEKPPEEDRGDFFAVSRKYFKREPSASGFTLKPLSEGAALAAGDEIEVQISLRAKHAAEYVHLRDPRAAGTEPERVISGYKWDLGIGWYEETRDSGSNFFFERLPAGEYTLKYRVRANMAGTFKIGPATVQSMYAPEFNAYSAGATLTVR
jgi:uncharacterized protein YfaS (alpha-2-macroglobulin family)